MVGTDPDYGQIREIHRGSRFVVLRGTRAADKRSVVIKAVLPGHADGTTAVARLRHEHDLLSKLDLPGIVRPLALQEGPDGPALVLEDAGPENLKQWLRLRALPTESFLELAIQIAAVLGRLHDQAIAHRDLNPFNLIVGDGGQLTLVDFDMAMAGVDFAASATPPAELQTALAYTAPEQTGRMKRPVDQRADLYSLGVIYYEMLTGVPPFTSADPVDLVHAHLARAPVPPAKVAPTIPPVLSDLVIKLLAKMPEARYQSAEAVLADLREARTRLQQTGVIAPFDLGLTDLARELRLPEELYGRERELGELEAAWKRVSRGARELLLVTGPAGIGKSALVEQLRGRVADKRGRFLSGKFDLRGGHRPYTSVVEAFRGLAVTLFEEPEAARAKLRERLRDALGANGRVITAVIPELEALLGEQPPLPELGPREADNRFRLVFQAFVQALAARGRPLVIFLDDLQWADTASLSLIKLLALAPDLRFLLLVGAFRPEEVAADHPVQRTLQALRKAGAIPRTIEPRPLDLEGVMALCCSALRCPPGEGRPLAELILRKTAGNPFFIKRLLSFLHRSRLLVFDHQARQWHWDLARIETVKVTDNVADLLVAALQDLPEATRNVTKTAACIGSRFPLALLAAVEDASTKETASNLWTAVDQGLLVQIDGASQARGGQAGGPDASDRWYQFAHDRVQQAAYSLLGEQERKAIHLRIGHLLAEEATGADGERALDDRIFTVVDQRNLGADLVTEPGERLRLADLNLRAARKAKASSAYGAALEYLRRAIALLPGDAWQTDHHFAFLLHREAVECAYLSDNGAVAEPLFEAALAHARSLLERADLYDIRVVASTVEGALADAIRWGREGLALFGVMLPEERLREALATEIAEAQANLQARAVEDLRDGPAMQQPEQVACMQLLFSLIAPTYASRQDLYAVVVVRMVNLSLVHGNSAHSAFAYVGYGVVLASITGNYERGHAFGRLGVELVRRSGDPVEECRVIGKFAAFVNNSRASFRSSVPLLREAVAKGLQSGEVQYASYWSVSLVKNLFHQGVELGRVLAEADSAITNGRKTYIRTGVDWQLPHRQAIRSLMGHTLGQNQFDDAEFDEAAYLASVAHDPYAQGLYQVLRLQVSYLFRDIETARALSVSSAALLDYQRGTPTPVEHRFYTALTLAALWDGRPDTENSEMLAAMEEHHRQLEVLAANCAENYRAKERLVAAEIARVAGQRSAAATAYDQAIEAAGREHLLRDEALGNELAGRFFHGLGRKRIADLYLSAALDAYARWGASAKVKALEQEFAGFDGVEVQSWKKVLGRTRGDRGGATLDLLGILGAAETISSEVVLDRLLEKVMDVCLANAGAERGALLLEREDGMVLRVVGSAGEAAALERTPLETAKQVPVTLIHEVRRTGEPIVLPDAAGQGPFMNDPYISEHGVRSALALPIQRQAKRVALLYLENNLATGVFTSDRLRVLRLLSSQMAISLENSLLFERLTAEVQERTRAEAEAARLYHEAREAVRLRDEFLSVASHELNTPMTSLMLSLQGLLGEVVDISRIPQAALRMIAVAERQGLRLSRLIGHLLDVTTIEQGRLSLVPEEIDLGELVRDVVEQFTPELERRKCRVSLSVPTGVRGWWDPMRLEQVVLNLLSNAAKFGAGEPIEIGVAEEGETARLWVIDHGIGIDPDRQGHIFERFGRAVSLRHYGGLGLGLYLCRRIVEAHGGSVAVESTPGQGAKFTVELPRRAWRERSETGGAAVAAPG